MMWRRMLACGVSLTLTGAALADPIVASGPAFGFQAPNPPYALEELSFELTIGYGSSSNTIGDGLWQSGPAVVDLSADPDLEGFLDFAANGLSDDLNITVRDVDGFERVFPFFLSEKVVFGRAPYTDLWPLRITGVRMNVWHVGPANNEEAGIDVSFDFLGIPEPNSLALFLLGFCFLRRVRK